MIQLASMIVAAVLAADDPTSHVVAHGIAPIFPDWNLPVPLGGSLRTFWFTNHLLMLLVAAVVMLLIFIPIGRRYQAAMAGVPVSESVPRGFASLIEGMMDALRTSVVRPVLGANTDRFMPFLWTVFFFILVCNLLGMFPVDALVGFFGLKHVGGTPTGNVNVTAGLALCAFLMIHFSGVRELFEQLVAGTFGQDHHGEGEAHAGDEHGDAHGHEARQRKGLSPVLALIAAFGIYAWNFAPHVFTVEHPRPKPAVAKRLVMIVAFVALLSVELFGIGLLVGGSAGGAVMMWVGGVLGFVFAMNAGGLHPIDFADALMWGFVFLLECIGAIVKPFALCMRLFANMIAGHIVLASILLLIPVFKGLTAGYLGMSIPIALGCVLLSCLELFVALLQAYIFMFLTTMFIGAAVHPEH